MNLPKISAYCATYGRPETLEEAIECFLRQDYTGPKELVILNDYKGHKLYFDHPEVKVYNLEEKINPLGKKFNKTVDLCDGEIIFVWEDDDIFLPNRISLTVQRMLNNNNKIFHTRRGYVEYKEGIIFNAIEFWKASPYFHSNLAIYKDVFLNLGGYEEIDQIDLDIKLMNKVFESQNYSSEVVELKDLFYIYRIETNTYHATSLSNIQKDVSEEAEKYVKSNNKIKGDYYLKPHWKYDYLQIVNKIKTPRKKIKAFRPFPNKKNNNTC